MCLTDDGIKRMIPDTDPAEYNPLNAVVMNMTWSVNSVYECENNSQLTKHYHASIGSHPE